TGGAAFTDLFVNKPHPGMVPQKGQLLHTFFVRSGVDGPATAKKLKVSAENAPELLMPGGVDSRVQAGAFPVLEVKDEEDGTRTVVLGRWQPNTRKFNPGELLDKTED